MSVPEVPNSKGVSVEIAAEVDGMQLQIVELAPGGLIGLHTHARPHTVVVIRGTGRETASGKAYSLGDHALFGAHQPHGWENTGDEAFCFASTSAGPGLLHNERKIWDMTPA
jgi:quercetin dioxygenase-like cupin family protein